MKCVNAELSKNYNVFIGKGLLAEAGKRIAEICKAESALIVTDNIVNELYADRTERSLKAVGFKTSRFVFPNGEHSKNAETYVSILNTLSEREFTRTDLVVALGGGVTGDLAGFAASTYLRGISFVQIPTTLLAMVDSSVGGKTGIDLPMGKNLAGAFYQPNLVLCDIDTLASLPKAVFRDGCAEMIKHGAALNAQLFEMLKKPLEPQMEEIIALNVSIKRDIVVMDEREAGIRQILNFGHTLGHSIEKLSSYNVSHGSAVAIGMLLASRGAKRMGLCSENCFIEIFEAIKRFNLPLETDYSAEEIIKAVRLDKKRSGQNITLILPEKIGKCTAKKFTMDEFAAFVKLAMEA